LTPVTGGTNICFINQPLRWWYKQLLSNSTPYVGGTNSYFLNQPLHYWW